MYDFVPQKERNLSLKHIFCKFNKGTGSLGKIIFYNINLLFKNLIFALIFIAKLAHNLHRLNINDTNGVYIET